MMPRGGSRQLGLKAPGGDTKATHGHHDRVRYRAIDMWLGDPALASPRV